MARGQLERPCLQQPTPVAGGYNAPCLLCFMVLAGWQSRVPSARPKQGSPDGPTTSLSGSGAQSAKSPFRGVLSLGQRAGVRAEPVSNFIVKAGGWGGDLKRLVLSGLLRTGTVRGPGSLFLLTSLILTYFRYFRNQKIEKISAVFADKRRDEIIKRSLLGWFYILLLISVAYFLGIFKGWHC